jgi:hypothetical protein
VIHHNSETGKNTIATDRGEIVVTNNLYESAIDDGKVLEIDENGKVGRNVRMVSPVLKKKVINRDGGKCTVPGCGKTHFLKVHHIVKVENGGSDREENLTTVCSVCHSLIHKYQKLIISGQAPNLTYSHTGNYGVKIPFGG